jgi:hypothetical protein
MSRMRIAVVGLALFVVACSGGHTSGVARPVRTEPAATTALGQTSATEFAGLKPCELISSAEAVGLGITAPQPRRTAGSETCEWDGKGNGGLTVALDTKRGIDGLNYSGDTKTPATFGKHQGFSVAAPGKAPDLCHAVISVTASSSVQVVASAGGASTDTAKACELATKSAELVAAKLP